MPEGTTDSCPPGLPDDLREKYLALDNTERLEVCKELAVLGARARHRRKEKSA